MVSSIFAYLEVTSSQQIVSITSLHSTHSRHIICLERRSYYSCLHYTLLIFHCYMALVPLSTYSSLLHFTMVLHCYIILASSPDQMEKFVMWKSQHQDQLHTAVVHHDYGKQMIQCSVWDGRLVCLITWNPHREIEKHL